MDNVVYIFGENCNTNKFIATAFSLPFRDFPSHRFNFTIQNISEEVDEIMKSIVHIMICIRRIVPAAKLQKLTSLKQVLMTKTRWSSTYKMMEHYQSIWKFSLQRETPEIGDTHLTRRQNQSFNNILERLECLNSILKDLQSDILTMFQTRSMFNFIVGFSSETIFSRSASADIFHPQIFESAVVKIQKRRYDMLTLKKILQWNQYTLPRHATKPKLRNFLMLRYFEKKNERVWRHTWKGISALVSCILRQIYAHDSSSLPGIHLTSLVDEYCPHVLRISFSPMPTVSIEKLSTSNTLLR